MLSGHLDNTRNSVMSREMSLKKEIKQNLVAHRYNLNELFSHQIRKKYQITIAYRFSALESLDISWVKIMCSIKVSAEEKVGISETYRMNKP